MKLIAMTLVCLATIGWQSIARGDDSVGEQLGKQVEEGVNRLGEGLRQSWAEIRAAAERMGVEARVYARLHWDKALQGATLDLEVRKQGTIALKGSVPTVAAKNKAVQLAQDTVGIVQVIDELAIVPAAVKTPK